MVNPSSAKRDYGCFYSILSADQITVIGNEELQMFVFKLNKIVTLLKLWVAVAGHNLGGNINYSKFSGLTL